MRLYPCVPLLLAACAFGGCEAVRALNEFTDKTAAAVGQLEEPLDAANQVAGYVNAAAAPRPEARPAPPPAHPAPRPDPTLRSYDNDRNNSPDPTDPIALGSTLALPGELAKSSADTVDYYAFKPEASGQIAISISNNTDANPRSHVRAEILLDGQRIALAGWATPDTVAPPNVKPTVYPDRVYFVKVTGRYGYTRYSVNLQLVPN